MQELSDKEIEDAKELFEDTLRTYAEMFSKELETRLKPYTIRKYKLINNFWIGYIINYSPAITFEQIKLSEVRSKFYNNVKYDLDVPQKETYNKLDAFLTFLKEHGFQNDKF